MKKFSVHLHLFFKRDLDGDCVPSSNNAPQPCFHKRSFLSIGLLSTQHLHHDFHGGVTLMGHVLMEQAVRQLASVRGSENCHSALRKLPCSVYLGMVTLS